MNGQGDNDQTIRVDRRIVNPTDDLRVQPDSGMMPILIRISLMAAVLQRILMTISAGVLHILSDLNNPAKFLSTDPKSLRTDHKKLLTDLRNPYTDLRSLHIDRKSHFGHKSQCTDPKSLYTDLQNLRIPQERSLHFRQPIFLHLSR